MAIRQLEAEELEQVSGGVLSTQFVSLSKSVDSVMVELGSVAYKPDPDCWCGTCVLPPKCLINGGGPIIRF